MCGHVCECVVCMCVNQVGMFVCFCLIAKIVTFLCVCVFDLDCVVRDYHYLGDFILRYRGNCCGDVGNDMKKYILGWSEDVGLHLYGRDISWRTCGTECKHASDNINSINTNNKQQTL
jgi:hypothetical protein